MKTYAILVASLVALVSGISTVEAQRSDKAADKQRRDMREFLRYQSHYQKELQKIQDSILEKNENLQAEYSLSIDFETIYLEASEAYEKMEQAKLAKLPEFPAAQKAEGLRQ